MIPPTVLKKEKKLTLKERAVAQLRTAIIHGELKSGTRLVEHELSQLLGISRLPIREALVTLEQAGLVTVVPYKGAVVSSFSIKEIRELFDLRILLETHALKLFLQKRDNSPLDKLYAVVEGMKTEPSGEDMELALYDYNFHSTLCSLGGNEELHNTWSGLSAKTQCCIAVELQQLSRQDTKNMHRRICDLIRQRDYYIAAKGLQDHLNWGKTLALRHFNYPITEDEC